MIRIDKEFKSVMRRLEPDEYTRLEESIIAEGCRDPIVLWCGVIVDGMNRYEICIKHDIPYKIHHMEFANREAAMAWMIQNQFSRRNLSMWDKGQLTTKLLPLVAEGNRKKTERDSYLSGENLQENNSQNSGNPKKFDAHREVAEMAGVSHDTVAKAKKIVESGTALQKWRLENGQASIHQIYTEIKESEKAESVHTFNRTNESIGFAKWSWNPHTGCEMGCGFCYGRDMAERFYKEGFKPTFRPERLQAPFNTRIPVARRDEEGINRVFVCSMGELFGPWVNAEDRERILDVVRRCAKENTRSRPKIPPWTFMFLTKYPYALMGIDWPDNVWVGTSVIDQSRVEHAERAFEQINAPVKFLSCEPLHTDLTFSRLDLFDMVMVGARTRTSKMPAFQPEWHWVEHVVTQSRKAGVAVYFKDNLKVRPKELPKGRDNL